MTRTLTLLIAGLLGALPVQADFTLVGRSTLTALNMPNQGREVLYVKKHQMRRDLSDRGRAYTYLYDLRRNEVILVDHFLRQYERHVLSSGKAARPAGVRLDLDPTGRQHPLADWSCEEHALTASMASTLGQEKVTVVLQGQVWLERRAKARKEIEPFVKAVEAEDFFVGAATPGKPASAQAEGINEAMRQVLGKGMVCAAEIQVKYEGGGPMADLARRMATRASLVYESISDEALADGVFVPPAGYRDTSR